MSEEKKEPASKNKVFIVENGVGVEDQLKLVLERTDNAFKALRSAAAYSLEKARESEDGQFYACMNTIVDSAFCLEGFLNHVGTA